MPNQLKYWDWRYRVFFDAELRDEVRAFIEKLEPQERSLYNELLNFHTRYYSPLQLSNALYDERLDNATVLSLANNNVTGLLYTPDFLKIELHPDAEEYKHMARHGVDAMYQYRRLIAKMFEHWLPAIKETTFNGAVEKDVAHGVPVGMFNPAEIDTLCQTQAADKWTTSMFGESKVPEEYIIDLTNDEGFGEWWDKGLTSEALDRLVLHHNRESAYSEDVKHTLLHEVYPGHGHFYAAVKNPDKFFDHGALELVEGWATFAEWNAKMSLYGSSVRSNSLCFLRDFFDARMQDRVVEACLRGERIGASGEFVNKLLCDMTQYIGYREAYYLGAVFFEICGDSPKTVLETLHGRNCGSFFSTWETMH